ncbi:protoporphyrinogen oxidase [Alienimonas chondri]|uniref:Coproporphyrinogen III oxidase n=1 Tax=Alienimonas chondri TaxID=2681879 RepID=A0ABX1VFA9_9PLAN|nr:protoporphyrinogen oxidase [Alienimonas chondri]NNJ26759.1 Protoporphyrinogen oxidase [Alienimonas chondri]
MIGASAETVPLRVAVVGAGVSGLAAAMRLVDLGKEWQRPVAITLFDPQPPGGACRTLIEEHAGESIVREMGPDSFLSRPPHLTRFCERIGLTDDLIGTNPSPRGALVWTGDRTERVPEGFTLLAPSRWGPTLRSPTLTARHKLRLLTEPWRSRGPSGSEEDESIAAFVRRRLGQGVLERLAQPLAAGIYAGDAEKLSLAACLPQFAADERTRGRITGKKPGGGAKADGGARYSLFVTPRSGVGSIASAATTALSAAGVDLRRESVASVRQLQPGWQVSAKSDEQFDAVVVAAPARVAAELLRGEFSRLSSVLEEIEYSSSLIVNTLHREADVRHPLDAFGLVIPERLRPDHGRLGGAGLSAFAVSFASRKFPGRAPAGWVQLRTFLGGVNRSGCVTADRKDVLAATREELTRLLGVSWSDETADSARITRWDRAMPQYNLGHLDRVAAIRDLMSDVPGLALAGNSLHGVGLPAATKGGTDAAERVFTALPPR